MCKVKSSSLFCRAPSLRTGKKTSLLKCPNGKVPSSFVDPVQDPGIKGPFFPEDCRQDHGTAGENMDLIGLKVGASAASAIAGESKETIELLEVCETDFSEVVGASVAAATVGEHKGIHGLLEVIESEFSSKSGSAATVSAETADQARVLPGTSSWFSNSRMDIVHEFMGRLIFHMHVHARLLLLPCLLVSLLGLPHLLLPLLHGFHVRLLQLLLILQVHVPHLCMMVHFIQEVLVVCCLCANPPVTTWRCAARVPQAGRGSKVGFSVRPKICALSQIWRQG